MVNSIVLVKARWGASEIGIMSKDYRHLNAIFLIDIKHHVANTS